VILVLLAVPIMQLALLAFPEHMAEHQVEVQILLL
jgi:hypothetical protein